MMSREDSPFTESPPRRPCTSCARSGRPRLAPMVPYLYTSDGRTIRYPDPIIKVHDSIQVDIATGKILDTIKFDSGNLCMITGGRNTGRVGTIMSRERHPGSFDIVHIKDSQGHTFATRIGYVFIIGKGNKPYISLPKGKGVKLSIAEERDKRLGVKRD